MKKLIFIVALVLFAAAACMEKKPAEFTRLGIYTPYQGYMEKLNGTVESVTETCYWAVAEGDSYIKGARITRKEHDSIGYTYDYKAVFDAEGDLVSSTTYDENGKVIDTWRLFKKNNLLAKSGYISDDTVRFRQVITCDGEGNPVLYEGYNQPSDTLAQKIEFEGGYPNDTLKVQHYNYLREPGSKYLFIFDEQGLLKMIDYFRKDDTRWSSQVLNYNDKGFQSEHTAYDKDKNVTARTYSTCEYDEKGNWTRLICKDDKGFTVIGERVYTYFKKSDTSPPYPAKVILEHHPLFFFRFEVPKPVIPDAYHELNNKLQQEEIRIAENGLPDN